MADKPQAAAAPTAPANYVLVVVHAFADYQRGDHITDPAKVAEILAGECATYCVKKLAEAAL